MTSERIRQVHGPDVYVYGLDVGLVFLPELYLAVGESRAGKERRILRGIEDDVVRVLQCTQHMTPLEINVHPYHRVDALPYDDADLGVLLDAMPKLQAHVDDYNDSGDGWVTHLFIGVEGLGYTSGHWQAQP